MITKLKLEKTEETFSLLGNYFPGYNKDRAMNGIGIKLKTQDDFEEYAEEVNIAIAKAKIEHKKLKMLERTYNFTFPSKNKDCLTTPHILFNTIKNTISETKKNILKFCPKNSRRAAGTYSTPTQTLEISYLGNQTPYTHDLYSDMYPDYVHKVFDLLDEYSNVATQNICLCQNLLEEENLIREDDDALLEIDKKCRGELEELAFTMVKENMLSKECISKEDLERRKKEAKSMKEMRRLLYHNITPTEYRIRVLKDFVMQGLANDLTQEESAIWTKEGDYDFVKFRVRPAIEGMSKKDNLPSHKSRNAEGRTIVAEYIACFMEWCRVPKGKTQLFFVYLQNRFAEAPLHLPKYNSVMGASKKVLDVKAREEYLSDFESYSEN